MRCLILFFFLCYNVAYSAVDSFSIYLDDSNYLQAKAYLTKEWKNSSDKSDSALIEWKIKYGKVARYGGDFIIGYKYLDEAYTMASETGSELLLIKSSIELADYLRSIREWNKALVVLNEIDQNNIEKYPYLQCRYYHRKAAIFNELNISALESSLSDSAILYSRRALTISKERDYLGAQLTSNNELGNIWEKKDKLLKANLFYDRALKVVSSNNLMDYQTVINNKARVFLKMNEPDSAIYYLNIALNRMKHKDWPHVKHALYKHLGKAYEQLGDTINATKVFLKAYNEWTQSEWERSRLNFDELRMKYEDQQNKVALQAHEQELEQSRKSLWVVSAVFLLIVSYLSALLFREKKKR